jgi:hypothetical protein
MSSRRRILTEAFGARWLTMFLSSSVVLFGASVLGRSEGSRWQWGLLARLSDEHARQAGLGMWLLGAFVILNAAVLRRDGRITHTVQIIAAASGTFLTIYQVVPGAVNDGAGKWVMYLVTGMLSVTALVAAGPRRQSPANLFQELADEVREKARPARPADPAAEIARIQALIAADIEHLRAFAPTESDQMRRLLDRYRDEHGTDTVETSTRPMAVRFAADTMVEDFADIYRHLTDGTGHSYALSTLVYTRTMADLVCDRTR